MLLSLPSLCINSAQNEIILSLTRNSNGNLPSSPYTINFAVVFHTLKILLQNFKWIFSIKYIFSKLHTSEPYNSIPSTIESNIFSCTSIGINSFCLTYEYLTMPYMCLFYTCLSSFYKAAIVFKVYFKISKSIYNFQFLTI